jgi:hypothetical protein
MSDLRSAADGGHSTLDATALAILGFVVGLCVNSGEPHLRWLLGIVFGQ